MLRNKTTLAPLGCAVVTCRSRSDADALAAKLDGHRVGRKTISATSELDHVDTICVSALDHSCRLPPINTLRPVFEQVGDVDVAEDGDHVLATYANAAFAVAAEAVFDRSVVEGIAIRVRQSQRRYSQKVDDAIAKMIKEEEVPCRDANDSHSRGHNDALELVWTARDASLQAASAPSAAPVAPPSRRYLAKRRISVVVARSNLTDAPPTKSKDKRSLELLAPLPFQCGSEDWRLGVWADAVSVCEALRLPPPPPQKQVAVVVAIDKVPPGRRVTATLTAFIESTEPRRSPLEARLCRQDDTSGRGPMLFASEEAVVCLFDYEKALKLPYFKDGRLRVSMQLGVVCGGDDDTTDTAESCGSTARVTSEQTPVSTDDRDSAFFDDFEDDLKGHQSGLSAALLNMWENQVATDCSVTCADGVTVRAHRAVLAARSGFFKEHFINRQGPADLHFNAEPSRIFKAMVCFAYSDTLLGRHAELLSDLDDAILLLDAASRFEVDGLADYVASHLSPSLDTLDAYVDKAEKPLHPRSRAVLAKLAKSSKSLYHQISDPDLAKFYLLRHTKDDLTEHLEAKVADGIRSETLVDLFELACSLDSDKLRRACLRFAQKNIETVMAQPNFTKFLQSRKDLVFELLAYLDGDDQGSET